jgi:integrase
MNITVFPKGEDKKGFTRLYLYCSINNTPGWFPTKIKIVAESWNQTKQMIGSKQVNHKTAQALLIKRIGQLNKVFQDLEYEGIAPTVDIVRLRYNASLDHKIVKAGVKQLELLEYIDQYVEDRKSIRSDKGYLRKFKPMKYWLVKFNPEVRFKDITLQFYNDWITLMYDEELESNTVSGYVKKLKSVLKAATMDMRTKHQEIPSDFLLFKDTYVKPKPFYLTWEEVKQIEDTEVLPELQPYKEEFLFRCYTGIRHSDLFGAKPENFIRRGDKVYLDFMSVKTRVDQNLLLSEKAAVILALWKWKPTRLWQSDCNDKIKDIARAAKLNTMVEKVRYSGNKRKVQLLPKWALVTTHTARRTFGRRWMENGGSIRNLCIYYGHSNEKQTAEYIGWTTEEVNAEVMRVIV